MPYTIDQEALDSPNMKILDINHPPMKAIGYQPFPKVIYLHPKDKTKQHLHKTVFTQTELDAAQAQGWRTQPHNPSEVAVDLSVHFEAEPIEERRGPGRPKAIVA